MKPVALERPQGGPLLVAFIDERAAEEGAQAVAEAQERAQRLLAAAVAEAEGIRGAARAEGEERGRRRAAKLVAVAEADARREWLLGREALIDAAVDRARAQLAAFPARPDAAAVLRGMVGEALAALPDGPVRVLLPAGWEAFADDRLRAAVAVGRPAGATFEAGDVPGGGVVVETADGRVRYDNSFEARMRRLAGELRCLVGEILVGDDAAARDVA